MSKSSDLSRIIDQLSPLERKIIPYLNLSLKQIQEKTNLDNVSLLRALQFLENKGILNLEKTKKQIIDLGTNGIYYKKNHLPERKLVISLEEKNHLTFEEAQKATKLSDNEFKAAVGALKDKAILQIKNGKLVLEAKKEELTRRTLEEQLLEILPIEKDKLEPQHQLAFQNLQKRKDILEIKEQSAISFKLTDIGKQLAGKEIRSELIEELTPEIIKTWSKKQKFRAYDIQAQVPQINAGKTNFVNQSIEYARRIWLDLGFKEMTGPMVDSAFWVFDALFTPQDHPAREMQDSFFIKDAESKLPDKKIVNAVKEAHEKGVANSKGWGYKWEEDIAKKTLLRTHTTTLSARTLSSLKKQDIPAKYFTIGKVFRNETLDWSHGFEFYQTEGIVIDKNVTFANLLGYLKEFYKKMGFEKIRFRPSFFAYTEPSVEIEVFHPEKKIWFELGGAGIFRPEVAIPLLGENIPILAWGQGFDRIIMDYHKIKDLREMYANDIKSLREKKAWVK